MLKNIFRDKPLPVRIAIFFPPAVLALCLLAAWIEARHHGPDSAFPLLGLACCCFVLFVLVLPSLRKTPTSHASSVVLRLRAGTVLTAIPAIFCFAAAYYAYSSYAALIHAVSADCACPAPKVSLILPGTFVAFGCICIAGLVRSLRSSNREATISAS